MKLTICLTVVTPALILLSTAAHSIAQTNVPMTSAQARQLGIFSPRDMSNSQLMKALTAKAAQSVNVSTSALAPLATTTNQNLRGFVSFDAPGSGTGGGQGTSPTAINLEGTITGTYVDTNFATHGFVRTRDGKIVSFDAPNSVNGTYPVAINDFGFVTGYFLDVNLVEHGFVRLNDCQASHSQNCTVLTFDAPDAGTGLFSGTSPTDINLEGEIDGYYSDSNGVPHGFTRSPFGKITEFDAPGANGGTFATGLNLFGAVTGYSFSGSAFIREANGQFTSVSAPNAFETTAAAIDLEGAITGWYAEPFANPFSYLLRGYLRTPSGQFQTFDAATYSPCCIFTYPTNVNDFGSVVGYDNDGYNRYHGFLRTNDGTITTFDAPSAGTGNFQGTLPLAINLDGMITGYYTDANGTAHGFVIQSAWQ